MKKKIVLILMTCFSFAPAFGQDLPKFSTFNVVKINPVTFASAEFQIQFEHYFKDRSSSISLIPSIILKDSHDESKEGWQLMSQYRFYLTHKNRNEGKTFLGIFNYGFYAGLYGLYLDYSEDYIRGYYDSSQDMYINDQFTRMNKALEGGALIGIQIDITQRIVIDFNIGGGVRDVNIEDTFDQSSFPTDWYDTYGVFDPEYQGVKPRLALLLGFTF